MNDNADLQIKVNTFRAERDAADALRIEAEAEADALREQLAQAQQERDAAVATEREACANVEPGMDTSNVLRWDAMTPDEKRMWKAGYSCAMDDYVSAIRARNAGK